MFLYAFVKSVEKMGYPIAFIAQDYINPRYFDHFRDELMRDFTLNSLLSKRNQALKQHILATPDSCFIHIRRGDYLISPSFIELGSAYYENALLELKAHILSPHCFIFNNDIL